MTDTEGARGFKVGDRVRWHSHGGSAEGKVVRIATEDGSIGDFDYRASEEEPKYIVENDEGARAVHTAHALERA